MSSDPVDDQPQTAPTRKGRPCGKCESTNTGPEVLSHRKPSVLYVLLFGWPFLLIRGAFAMRKDRCRDCGHVTRYKSVGSWVALAFLILLSLCVAAAIIDLNSG